MSAIVEGGWGSLMVAGHYIPVPKRRRVGSTGPGSQGGRLRICEPPAYFVDLVMEP